MSKKHVFINDYGLSNFHNAISLVESGYRVTVLTDHMYHPERYYNSLGIECLSAVQRETEIYDFCIEENVDIFINTNPFLAGCNGRILSICRGLNGGPVKHEIEFLGLYQNGCRLELDKFFMRLQVEDIGVKCAPWTDNYDYVFDFPKAPYVMKPKYANRILNLSQIVASDNIVYSPPTEPVFIEEFVESDLEVNIAYCVSRGKYSILHHQEVIGEDECKHINNFIHWTKLVEFKNLSEEHAKVAVDSAKTILDWMVKYDAKSSFVGQITGLIKDNEFIFLENNVRPEQTNSLPFYVSGDEFLDAMRGNPDILGDAFPQDIEKIVVIQKEDVDAVYPFHLHEKYNVAIPCGLDIIDGEYRQAFTFRKRSPDAITGMVVADKEIPQGFIDELNLSGWHVRADCRPPFKRKLQGTWK
jgi:hypothetical protein